MRIVLAIHHFPPTFNAGAEQHAYRCVKELKRRGHSPRVVCIERIDSGSSRAIAWQDDIYDGIDVRRLSFKMPPNPQRREWEFDNPLIGEHVRELLQREPPDVFHLFSGYLMTGRALRVAQELNIPTVVTLTDFWFLCPRITMIKTSGEVSSPPFDPVTCARCLGEEQRRYRWPGQLFPRAMQWFWAQQHGRVSLLARRQTFLRETLLQVDRFLSPSEFLRRMFISQGVDSERIELSRQGIDLPAALTVQPRPIDPSSLQIGYVGQLAEQKGVHVLISAVRRLAGAPVTLRIYGNPTPFPTYTARLRQLADNDPRIVFAGTYAGVEERHRVFSRLDVTVVPSVWYENNPLAMNEALGHGIPVLATDLGSMPETVIDGVNGLLFRDDADLARQIRRLLDEPGLLARLQAGITPRMTVAGEVDHVERTYRAVAAPAAASSRAGS